MFSPSMLFGELLFFIITIFISGFEVLILFTLKDNIYLFYDLIYFILFLFIVKSHEAQMS